MRIRLTNAMLILCWLGLHHWQNTWALHGYKYQSSCYVFGRKDCKRCGKFKLRYGVFDSQFWMTYDKEQDNNAQ